jgi:malate dehydrogenase (oxaloacetate-decarboxylating)(NADP+)
MSDKILDQEALLFHSQGRPGKLEIAPTKSLATQKELSLAYSPGVAAPCLEIEAHPHKAYDYTAKGNIVAVISNGTAVLGLGNIGALASKPVMEGKAVLFKRFADIDGIDLEVATENVEEFINAVRYLGPSFGGINLEDIKAPECFIIEDTLKKIMDIPVFHDDQHGTAIAVMAGLINAFDIAEKDLNNVKIVFNGAGAASIACSKLIKKMGVPAKNILMADRNGIIYKGRTEGMNPWKEELANETPCRTLEEALYGADVFIGLSAKGAVSKKMVENMAPSPIIFAMANPAPEITPEEVFSVRQDAIMATGRSDYPNQVNNALCFPYIFRGALDVQATLINDEMKMAAAHAIAKLARSNVPEEVNKAYAGKHLRYGRQYIIPVPFDPRLIEIVPPAVAKAAMDTGVARKPIENLKEYAKALRSRLDPTYSNLELIIEKIRAYPKKVIFAEGEEEVTIRAAVSFLNQGLGEAILIGREKAILNRLESMDIPMPEGLRIHNAKKNTTNNEYIEFLYQKLQRKGYLHRDCQRLVHLDRNIFGSCMVAFGEADALVTGITRNHSTVFDEITKVIDAQENRSVFGLSILVLRDRTVFIADTSVHENPSAQTLADIAIQSAAYAKFLGHEPRVAFLSYSNFGNPSGKYTTHIREAVQLLDQQHVDFEYEGDMSVDVALTPEVRKQYPFCRLSGPANILIMPDLHSANISAQLLQDIGKGNLLGPLLIGMTHSIQIAPMTANANDLTNLAALGVYQAAFIEKNK